MNLHLWRLFLDAADHGSLSKVAVLHGTSQPHVSRQIAELLDLSPRTIDHHRANLVRKFGLRNTVELVHHVVRNGFLTVGTEKITGYLP